MHKYGGSRGLPFPSPSVMQCALKKHRCRLFRNANEFMGDYLGRIEDLADRCRRKQAFVEPHCPMLPSLTRIPAKNPLGTLRSYHQNPRLRQFPDARPRFGGLSAILHFCSQRIRKPLQLLFNRRHALASDNGLSSGQDSPRHLPPAGERKQPIRR